MRRGLRSPQASPPPGSARYATGVMVHPDTALLRAYLDGRLSAGEAVRLEHHVAACAACRLALDRARAPARGEGHVLASRVSPRRRTAALALACGAALVIAVAVGAYVRTRAQRAPRAGPAATAATPAPKPPPPPPSPPPLPMAAPLRAAPAKVAALPHESAAAAPVVPPPSPPPSRADSQRAAPDAAPDPWREIGFEEAGRLLGRPPLAVPGLPIRRLARPRGADTLVVVEQTLDSGTVLRLYERRLAAGHDSAAGREVAGLHVAIEAALPADSLARLLARVQ